MTDAIAERVLAAEGFAQELQACDSIEEYSPLVRKLLTDGRPGLLLTFVATNDGHVKRLSQLVADTRHRLAPGSEQPVRPLPPRSAARYPRRTR